MEKYQWACAVQAVPEVMFPYVTGNNVWYSLWSRCRYIFSQHACVRSSASHAMSASLLCEVCSCLPHFLQAEESHSWYFCGFGSGGAQRTSWRPSWQGGGNPGWCSASLTWWGCQKRGHGPDTQGHFCIQSLWRCWGSLGAPPAASSRVCSAGWRCASSCAEEGY